MGYPYVKDPHKHPPSNPLERFISPKLSSYAVDAIGQAHIIIISNYLKGGPTEHLALAPLTRCGAPARPDDGVSMAGRASRRWSQKRPLGLTRICVEGE
jgi:hypothetical protein